MLITALISRLKRDVDSCSPKVTLRDIVTESGPYRDHAHIEITDEIDRLLRSKRFNNNKWHPIYLEADEKIYKCVHTGEPKRTLKNIKLSKLS